MLKRLLIIFLCIIVFIPNVVYASDIDISASSAIVMDSDSGTILYEHNAYEARTMASTTKIMTCLIACESGKLDKTVTISEEMLNGVEGSAIYIEPDDKITLRDLVKGAMIASGNDAANSIAFYLGKSLKGFASLMNNKASEIGMKDTVFVTPSGLDEGDHHSTAYDMALLASAALENKEFAAICKMKSAEIAVNGEKQTVYNHNKLLSYDDSFIGVKTGFTEKSGRCLVSAYDYEGNTIITVTLGDPDDWDDHTDLAEYASKQYEHKTKTDDFCIPVVGGADDIVLCSASYDIVTLGDITAKAYYYPFIYAPVSSGDVVGREEIYSNNKLIMTVDITVRDGVEQWQTITK
ncbi:MAG: D-alanyl-D-alanine carboxypeptidase family protein [Eubacterium sp.]